MGVCSNEDEKKRKQILENEIKINESKQNTKKLITKIETDIKLLLNEIKDLYNKVKTNDGNITNQEKKEIKSDLYEKVKKCKKLYLNRRFLRKNLGKIDDLDFDKEVNAVLERINDIFEQNQVDSQIIKDNIRINDEREDLSEIRYQIMEGNINDKKNDFEKDIEINNFMKEFL
jgi:hypothetical protein